MKLLGTGIALSLAGEEDECVALRLQTFADIEADGEPVRVLGTYGERAEVGTAEDPTTALVGAAHEYREGHLGDILGDLRRDGADITRFEFYAAPFRIELAADLRDRLKGLWNEREPRG